jgi:DNA-binding NarL/FixJ family response regulator
MSPQPSEPAGPVRIVIADDHPIFRDGLRKLLESEPGFSVVGEAEDGIDAITVVRTLHPDVLLLDIAMPRLGGLETLSALQGLPTSVLVLTAAITDMDVARALRLGARGVVLKEAATRQLLDGIRRVVRGQFVVGDSAAETTAEAIQRPASERARLYGLTRRELDIITAIVAGESNKEVAERLSISIQTVKHHLTNIFDKTGVSSRLELALFAVSQRLIGED